MCPRFVSVVASNPDESRSPADGAICMSMQKLLRDRSEIDRLRGFDNDAQAAAGIFAMTLETAAGVTADRLQHGFDFLPAV